MFDDVISGEKAPLGRILRNFLLHMRALFQGNPFWVTYPSVTSFPVAMSVMRNGTFCTTTIVRKKRENRLPVRIRSLPLLTSLLVTWLMSFPVTCILVTSLPVAPSFAPPEMWLEPCWYTTNLYRSSDYMQLMFNVHFSASFSNFISKPIKDRGNSLSYYRKFPTQSIQQKNTSKLDEK